jgi:hypothetical protein
MKILVICSLDRCKRHFFIFNQKRFRNYLKNDDWLKNPNIPKKEKNALPEITLCSVCDTEPGSCSDEWWSWKSQ